MQCMCCWKIQNRDRRGRVHRLCGSKILGYKRCDGTGDLPVVPGQFQLAQPQLGTCCLHVQRRLHRSKRRPVHVMRYRDIQNRNRKRVMRSLRGRDVFWRTGCVDLRDMRRRNVRSDQQLGVHKLRGRKVLQCYGRGGLLGVSGELRRFVCYMPYTILSVQRRLWRRKLHITVLGHGLCEVHCFDAYAVAGIRIDT